MNHEDAAQERLKKAAQDDYHLRDAYNLGVAQVHATLALVEEVRRLGQIVRERDRRG